MKLASKLKMEKKEVVGQRNDEIVIFVVWIGTHAQYNKINAKEVNYVKNN
jgi:hypothetical protein